MYMQLHNYLNLTLYCYYSAVDMDPKQRHCRLHLSKITSGETETADCFHSGSELDTGDTDADVDVDSWDAEDDLPLFTAFITTNNIRKVNEPSWGIYQTSSVKTPSNF